MKKISILPVLSILFVLGCATTGVTPPKTQLQIREFQTRLYDTNDVKMVMKALINVLQDEGFIVKHASVDLGLLNATKEVDVENKGESILLVLLLGADARWKKNSIIECTGNVSEFGKQVRVRINFQMKLLDNRGNVIKVGQVEDLRYYQDFFSKVDKGIFIQKEKL